MNKTYNLNKNSDNLSKLNGSKNIHERILDFIEILRGSPSIDPNDDFKGSDTITMEIFLNGDSLRFCFLMKMVFPELKVYFGKNILDSRYLSKEDTFYIYNNYFVGLNENYYDITGEIDLPNVFTKVDIIEVLKKENMSNYSFAERGAII